MKAVFLDRDGTIVEERGYVTAPEFLNLVPGAAAAIASLKERGWKVFVVTNQGAVAKGLLTEDELTAIHQAMVMMLGAEGALPDGIYYCPHHPDGTEGDYASECGCRKPKPGLLERAASENGLDLSASVMVGDSTRDIGAGKAAGVAATVLVLTGHGAETAKGEHGADHVAADLAAAVEWISAQSF